MHRLCEAPLSNLLPSQFYGTDLAKVWGADASTRKKRGPLRFAGIDKTAIRSSKPRIMADKESRPSTRRGRIGCKTNRLGSARMLGILNIGIEKNMVRRGKRSDLV